MRNLYLLFGEMGSGKNHLGGVWAEHLGCRFFDGDDALPDALARKVKRMEGLTLTEVQDFVLFDLAPRISRLLSEDDGDLIVGQALYRQSHRDMLCDMLRVLHDVRIIRVQVRPPGLITHIRRLLSRPNGWRWVLLMLVSKPFFQRDPGAIRVTSREGLTGEDLPR